MIVETCRLEYLCDRPANIYAIRPIVAAALLH